MAARLGIELSPAAYRLIELDGRRAAPSRVRSFAILPPSGADTDAMFASLKGREAAVVVWGTPSEHRQVIVTLGRYETMRREAMAALGTASDALVDIAPVGREADGRQTVVAAVAEAAPILAAIRPLLAAGIRVRSLATPAMALASLALTRRGVAEPASIEAYIAIEETATCVALMSEGALAIARELPWGYIDGGAYRPREDLAQRLASELRQYLESVGAPTASQVCICGGVPELRTMSAILTDRLDVEVEPLDSLFGIDESRLPEPVDQFRDRVAEIRPVWAVAADAPSLLNLLRAQHRERSQRALAAAAIVAGVAAGVGGAWRIATRALPPSPAPTTVAATRQPAPTLPHPRPSPSASTQSAAAAPPANPPRAPAKPVLPPPVLTAPSTPPRVPVPRDTVSPPPPPPVLQRRSGTESTPSRVGPRSVPAPSLAPVPATVPAPTRSTAARADRPEAILPFDASLETILYSSDRKFAIVDGRIVGVGDIVRGARIVEISPTSVTLRDSDGRLRRLALGGAKQQ